MSREELYAENRELRRIIKQKQDIIDAFQLKSMGGRRMKHILADAKVGDLCKTDLDEWIQIDDTSEPPSPILYHFDRPFKGNIIHTEPLAPEGSAEWALQMWKLGNDIRNETSGVVLMADYESEEIRVKHLVDVFPSGWQLYEEPKPEPEPPREPEYVICKRCGGTGYEIKPEPEQPKSAYKVGDFVVCTYYRSPLPQRNSYERVIEVSGNGIVTMSNDGCVTEYDINGNHGDINGWHIERLVKPEEYIICIGCLSGTIRYCLSFDNDGVKHDAIKIFNSNGKSIAVIRLEALDTETRELVESLLEAMQGEE